ncbi:HEAT repeat domain-containing protein [Anaerobaca lacustris]|uniref:HEAT repeat domain-containing protein n=1 Tax=Anaerobaca lacustris TaxID=3044600 RepID=A0AAW6TZ41_9BACT|nr:HEAT repeat domain-containing protein [Sedimentisphaerales bacterium M17dextr]
MRLSSKRNGLVLIVVVVATLAAPHGAAAADAHQEVIDLVIDELRSGDPERQAGAIAIVRDIPGEAITMSLAEELAKLSPAVQVQLLSTLADRGDATALPAVMQTTNAQDESVRVAALRAVGQLGGAEEVSMLAQRAAQSRGQEQKAARDSLYRLRGSEVNATIVKTLTTAAPEVKVELIRAVGERNIIDAVATLLQAANDEDRRVRLESLKVLRVVADPKTLPALIDLTLRLTGQSDRTEGERTVSAVARKIEEPNRRAAPVLAALANTEKISDRASLLRMLGRIGDNSALAALRAALAGPEAELQDAAIRALADWPTPEPVDDLLQVAQTSDNPVHKVLSLRGFVRLLDSPSGRSAEETVALYGKAMDLAPNAVEQKRVLAGLGGAGTLPALRMAARYLENAALQVEAESAIVRIAQTIQDAHRQECHELLAKVIRNTKNDTLREQAQSIIDAAATP